MSHDKIGAAARKRMAETGEPSAGDHIPPPSAEWFTISYGDTWSGTVTDTLDRFLFRAGRGASGAEVGAGHIRVRMGSFKLDIPRSSVRSIRRSAADIGGTTGVHGRRGQWLVNGSSHGLVELAIDPPCRIAPGIDTLFGLGPSRVNQLTVSLDDADGFIAAVNGDGAASQGQVS